MLIWSNGTVAKVFRESIINSMCRGAHEHEERLLNQPHSLHVRLYDSVSRRATQELGSPAGSTYWMWERFQLRIRVPLYSQSKLRTATATWGSTWRSRVFVLLMPLQLCLFSNCFHFWWSSIASFMVSSYRRATVINLLKWLPRPENSLVISIKVARESIISIPPIPVLRLFLLCRLVV